MKKLIKKIANAVKARQDNKQQKLRQQQIIRFANDYYYNNK